MLPRSTLRLDSSAASIQQAADVLYAGGLVAIPTETVYGLAAHALDAAAVAGIFEAKQRPGWDPLIVHVHSAQMLARVAQTISVAAQALVDAFWPGPLTLLLPRTPAVPDAVTAARPLVGVRMPAHPVALALLRAADLPLAAPSANRFGHISPSTAAHVLADLDGRIDAVIDAGPTQIGLESTVLDPNTVPITIYRQGAVTAADVTRVTGIAATVFQPTNAHSTPESLPSPGVGIRHYAPRTPLQLVASQAELDRVLEQGQGTVAVLQPADWALPARIARVPWGRWDDTAELAANLYAGLRALDATGTKRIIAPLPDSRPGDDLREALRDRLQKAAMPPG